MRILVVEDNAKLAGHLRRGLAETGYVVDVATDGIDGRHMAIEGNYDLVLLDVMLPEVHGYEVCHRVKTNPKTARIKVIMLTAKAFPADRHQAKDVGADDFLAKPVDPSILVDHVNALLSGAKPSFF